MIGRAGKKYTTWRLERGCALGHLEQVMQSRTLVATIITQLSLRSFGSVSACLLLIWALSPLGSQSCLRILSIDSVPITVDKPLTYVDTMANQIFLSDTSRTTNVLNPVYVASILSPPSVKNSSMDLWGNVKIPYMSDLSNLNSDRWLPISDTVPEYSSLLGIPLGSMESGNTTLSLESTYISLDCSSPANGPGANIVYTSAINESVMPSIPSTTYLNGTFWSPNLTSFDIGSDVILPPWIVATDVSIPIWGSFESFQNTTNFEINKLEVNKSRLVFQSARNGSWGNGDISNVVNSSDSFTVAYCGLSQTYVESNVTCVAGDGAQNCRVTAQRPSQRSHSSPNLTMLAFEAFFWHLVPAWVEATGPLHTSRMSSIAEYYLQNASTSFILETLGSGDLSDVASLSNLSASDFSHRLGQLLNTYLLGSQMCMVVSGDQDNTWDSGFGQSGFLTTAYHTQIHELYVCSWGWLAVLILASLVMLTASGLAAWFEFHTRIPDVLGFCSTITRDAPFLKVTGGNTLDGLERTKMLMDLRLTLGVVNGAINEEGVEHIAVAPAGEAKRPVRGKLYM